MAMSGTGAATYKMMEPHLNVWRLYYIKNVADEPKPDS